MLKSILSIAVAGAALLTSTTAGAATLFDFTGNSAIDGLHGNSKIFTGSDGTQVRASAWSFAGTTVLDSFLGVYGNGLGVTSGDDGDGGRNTHVIDNHGRRDFVLLQFDKAVSLEGGKFSTFDVLGRGRDSDATLAYGSTTANWQGQLALDGQNVSVLNAMFTGDFNSLGTSAGGTRSFGTSGSGNLWLVGASFGNADGQIDGFKLGSVSANVVSAVPEPATWGMMLVGFGATGGMLRHRRRDLKLAIA